MSESRSLLRRLDHVAVAVRDTEQALRYFCGRLGLQVVASEERPVPPVRLTYLDAGNAFIQLVQPLEASSPIARSIEEQGEGLHHLCFAVDDVAGAVAELAEGSAPPATLGGGRGRVSAFVPGRIPHGLRIECTEFSYEEDVEGSPRWLA